jgi:hypothetical protein
MATILTYLAFLIISLGLTVFAGRALSSSGRAFLLEVFGGNEDLATAVDRLLVVGFYLLNTGFVLLTMRNPATVTSARQALGLLSVKLAEVLVVLGLLYLVNLMIFARLRRRPAPMALWRPR